MERQVPQTAAPAAPFGAAHAGGIRLHLWVSGKVQGVSFRVSMEREARRLGLRGWVRNLPDGRVEAVAEGPEPAVEALVAWSRRGPPGAVVHAVDSRQEAARGEDAFHLRRTPDTVPETPAGP